MNLSLERKRNKKGRSSGLCSDCCSPHFGCAVVADASGLLELWPLLPLRGAVELCGWVSRSHNTHCIGAPKRFPVLPEQT